MITIAVDDNDDIYIGPDKTLALATGLDAVRMTCKQYMRTLRNEMVYQFDEGMPLFETALRTLNIPQFIAAGRLRLKDVPEVVRVQSFTAALVGNELQYVAQIESTYGPLELSENA